MSAKRVKLKNNTTATKVMRMTCTQKKEGGVSKKMLMAGGIVKEDTNKP